VRKVPIKLLPLCFVCFFSLFPLDGKGKGSFCVSLSPMHVWHASWEEGFSSWIWRNLLLIVKYVVVVVGALGLRFRVEDSAFSEFYEVF